MLTLRYELQEQLWANAQGTAYRALDRESETPVELRFLATGDELMWPHVLRRLRLARLIESPLSRTVLALELDTPRPFVVLAASPPHTLEGLLEFGQSMPADAAPLVIHEITRSLLVAHRAGLSHGRLSPETIGWSAPLDDPSAHSVLDYTLCPDPVDSDGAADVLQLHLLWSRLTGSANPPGVGLPRILKSLIEEMASSDPFDRPTVAVVHRALGDWLNQNATILIPPTARHPLDPPGVDGPKPLHSTPTEEAYLSSTIIGSVEEPADPRHKATEPPVHPPGVEPSQERVAETSDPLAGRTHLGRFRLLGKLGEGGMGTVWKGEDPVDGRKVAIKLLRPDRARDATMLKRFHREARLLAEVNNPHVANILEVNADGDAHYFVMEFVDGRNLLEFIQERGRLPEREAAAIAADVARAMLEAHERGIVHRDLKPENILICRDNPGAPPLEFPQAKLTDFGLARHVEETDSLLTTPGAVLGTPLYFSPEQCSGTGDIDVRADVYSLGATLFHALVGRPPFESHSVVGLINKHLNEPPPRVRTLVPELTEAVEEIVAKCLQKNPDSRFENASQFLSEIERLLRGEPTSIVAHPQVPTADARDVLAFDFQWELQNPPQALWPHVSNTERLNRAIGLPSIEYSAEPETAGGVRRFAQFRKMGMSIAWREHPFEWIEGRRLGVFREFHQGPWKWFTSVVELTPRAGGGTALTHRIRLLPANVVGRVAGQIEVGTRTRKALEKVYRRIDTVLSGGLGALADPFEDARNLSTEVSRRLEERLRRVIARGADPFVVERLGDYLATAPVQELSRIRPLALANRLSLDERQLLSACLIGAREGLLTMLWDIVCPLCRIPSQIKDSLKAIREHGQCAACQSDFELDFANSIELVFRLASDIQDVETGTYCIGGPAHSPHVVAQVRLAAGERFHLDLNLAEGAYRIRGPQLPYVVDFRVVPQARLGRCELSLRHGPGPESPRQLKPGAQLFILTNDASHEIVARVERMANRADACTAARAAANPLFRELFPQECLAPEQLVHVQQVTLLSTRLRRADALFFQLGDSAAFARLHSHFRDLDAIIRREGGSLIKTVGTGVRGVFTEPVMAMRAALAMIALKEPDLLASVHRGPALVATINDLLDYFGSTVSIAEQLLDAADRRSDAARPQVVVSDAVGSDANVAAAARQAGLRLQPRPEPLMPVDSAATTDSPPLYVLELDVATERHP